MTFTNRKADSTSTLKKRLLIGSGVMLGVLVVLAAALVVFNPLRVTVALAGEMDMTLEYGENFKDPGAAAHIGAEYYPENIEDLPVAVKGEVDTHKVGEYKLRYSAEKWGFLGEATRTVRVVDTKPPSLSLTDPEPVTLSAGSDWAEPGFSASDDVDGDLSEKVAVEGAVDTMTVGEYKVTYQVQDTAGNKAEAERVVTVEPVKQVADVNPGHKVVYLTFDDGPSAETPKLLDILKEHNVHATFFVTGQGDPALIGRAASEGNAIGLHTMTHNYQEIYASKEAYIKDMEQISAVVEAQTGKRSRLLRFPGGSSNRVSEFNPGIMTTLTRDIQNLGYKYFDWNVDSRDAGGASTPDEVYENVVAGIQGHDVSVVLQHDTHGFSVEAVDKIVKWGLSHGYTFLPLDDTSPQLHHSVQN